MSPGTPQLIVIRNRALAALAWVALLLYILACRPSWSPDGSRLLVPFYDPATKGAGVALVERSNGATRTIVADLEPSSSTKVIPAQWDNSGDYAILWLEEHELLLWPIDPSVPGRTLKLPDEVEWIGFPTPELDGSLYFSGEPVAKIDLATGEVTSRETDGQPLLFQGRREILYNSSTYDVVTEDGKVSRLINGYEIGKVDRDELTFEPLFRLEKRDLDRAGIEALSGYVAVDPNGRRFAFTATSELGARIILCNREGLERIFVPQISADTSVLGNIEWSPTTDVLYAAALTSTETEDVTQFSVAEISLDGAATRFTPLGRIQKDIFDDFYALQIALSPDGSTIAASTAQFVDDDLSPSDRAVFLVDLEDPERGVIKIPLPPSRAR